MNRKILLLFFFLLSLVSFSQEINYKEYSYSQFVEMLTSEKDSVFKLIDAIIKYDSITDKEFLVPLYFSSKNINDDDKTQKRTINKAVELDNVQFLNYDNFDTEKTTSLHSFIFKKPVVINSSFFVNFSNCEFQDNFFLTTYEYGLYRTLKAKQPDVRGNITITESQFSGDIRIVQSSTFNDAEANNDFGFTLGDNIFKETVSKTTIYFWKLEFVYFGRNIFNNLHPYYIQIEETTQVAVEDNLFQNGLPQLLCIEIEEFDFKDNVFNTPSLINLKVSNSTNFIGGNIFNETTNSLSAFDDYRLKLAKKNNASNWWNYNTIEYFNKYNKEEKIQNLTYYQYELDQKSVFYNYFKERHNTTQANKFYTQIKDLENQRLIYEYDLEPNFNKYFKIQINKFLKLFSNYGTEPERAVIVSLYVILFFAFIYLLFPNTWDIHGKKRIMNRYSFFFTYMNKQAGMHEVYLEEKKADILEFDDFKTLLEKQGKTVPKFFRSTALPLYKWSISGTKLSASLLKHLDIMKGTWEEVPNEKRLWKSFLLIFVFVIAIIYDLFIKVLNALMLSINTFTTLGFGEIPIKGLPRYLAIIQGFIGWFMLTIFSVSLISQLLN